ncbi:MAG: ExbD/TolR family protein, partial [bacterium]
RKKVHIHLNITPLIDIVFQLVIFFMLTANFIMQPGIELNLSGAKHAPLQEHSTVIVSVSKDGDVFVNENAAGAGNFEDILEKELQRSRENTVMFKSDSSVLYGAAIKVMDGIKNVHSGNVVILTKEEK